MRKDFAVMGMRKDFGAGDGGSLGSRGIFGEDGCHNFGVGSSIGYRRGAILGGCGCFRLFRLPDRSGAKDSVIMTKLISIL